MYTYTNTGEVWSMPARLTQNIQNALPVEPERLINTFASLMRCWFLHYKIASTVYSLRRENTAKLH